MYKNIYKINRATIFDQWRIHNFCMGGRGGIAGGKPNTCTKNRCFKIFKILKPLNSNAYVCAITYNVTTYSGYSYMDC